MEYPVVYRAAVLVGSELVAVTVAAPDPALTGYSDTPVIPGSSWHVHDGARPRPPVVQPGHENAQPPWDAVVLFDGHDLDAWQTERGGKPGWRV